jgi:hypothetical protein
MSHAHTSTTEARALRQLVRTVSCPKCGAEVGQKCIGVRTLKRSASHKERWGLYRGKSL